MKVVQVKCPQCNTPIQMKQKDHLFYCSTCGTLHTRDEGVERLDYEIAEIKTSSSAARYYQPFWRLYCDFIVNSREVKGGTMFKIASLIKGSSDGGSLFIFVPASEMDINSFRHWAVQLTTKPPMYATRKDFGGVERIPASVSRKEAEEMADFVAVTLEAEQPGTLQKLDYTLKVNASKVIYLPFVQASNGLALAI